ncbi:MAG: septum site-determining protein MinC [Tardiphaga sp.]|jgi:septum site-determining protein MinC
MSAAVAEQKRPLARFRGRSYVAFTFTPTVPIVDWIAEIDATMAQSAGFFAGRPVVLDMSVVDLSTSAILHLITTLEERGIRVLGLEGLDADKVGPGLPPLVSGGRNCLIEAQPEPKAVIKPQPKSLLLEQPVRSGQSIVFTEGDVTVVGSISSGAEVVAGGSIHIYGTLRGRAMAGVNGNSSARIYCHKLEAELLAIDGYYKTIEDIDTSLRNRPAQAWLEGEVMKITALN